MKDPEKKVIIGMLDDLIRRVVPEVKTFPKYGGTLYSHDDYKQGLMCGIFVYTNHVQLSFVNGPQLKNPQGVLMGNGHRRHLNFHSADEVNEKVLLPILKDAAKLAK